MPAYASKPPSNKRLWKAMRIQKECDVPMLAMAAGTSEGVAGQWLGVLVRGGYVQIVTHGNARHGMINRYRLVRNSGPFPPKRCFDFLQDGNTGEVFPLAACPRRGRAAARVRRNFAERRVTA